MKEIPFKTLLLQAKQHDNQAMTYLVVMYRSLLFKEAIVEGELDEDLLQELHATLVRCVYRIHIF